jgi:acetyl esterase/lipase
MRLTCLSIVTCFCASIAGLCQAAQSVNPAAPQFTRQRDIVYGRKHGMALTLDVFTPKDARGFGVLWILSGSGRSSSEMIDRPSYQRCFRTLLAAGYTIFAVVHSSAPRFTLQDMVPDVHRAVRFVRCHAGEFDVDASRLGIAGASAGGTLALLIGTTGSEGDPNHPDPVERASSRVQAVGCFFAPSDWLGFDGRGADVLAFQRAKYGSVDPSFAFYEIDPNQQTCRVMTDERRIQSLLREYSPVAHVTQGDAPTLIIHGDADPFIPIQQSKRIIQRFEENRVPCQLVVKSGKGHGWENWESDTALIADWFDIHLCREQ